MSRRERHTHRGHCQACGALQAIETGREPYMPRAPLAKHGYKVTWGFFSGVCSGSGHPALEFDRTITDATRKELLVYAIGQDTRARELRNRTAPTPDALMTGTVANPEYGKGATVKRVPRFLDVTTPWAECTDAQRDRWYAEAINAAELKARSARNHRAFLFDLIARVHGKEPQAVNRTPQREPKVGDEFERYDTKWRVIGEAVTRGYGRGTKYVRCLRLDNSKEVMMRVQDVRKALGA